MAFGVQLIRASQRHAPCTLKAALIVVPEGDLPHILQITAQLEGPRLADFSAEPLPPGAKGVVAVDC
jgi:hypothetical protein